VRKEWIKYTEETTRWSKNETDQIFSFFFLFFPLACLVFFLLFEISFVIFSHEKMEIEDEHEQLKAVRRNCEKLGLLVSSSSSSDEKEEETTTTTISNCLRSLRALFSRKKEVSPKECLRVRSFLF
tara:strand:+ start:13378 stop:13755 length:378 start_codon:yes stop_codon:yes gene_type:complete